MAMINKNVSNSDDEEDLESLRLAALQSLKSKPINYIDTKPSEIHATPQYLYKQSFGAAQTTRHHNRGFRNNSGRPGRNGLSSRVRTNTNLISIQTIDQNEPKEGKVGISTEVPKLTLPQDRYHKPVSKDTPKECKNNKFDRYNNSDDSESDIEEVTKSTKRERKDSLEQLMDELENEISVLDKKNNLNEELKTTDKSRDEDSSNSQLSRETETDNIEYVHDVTVLDDTLIITENKHELELDKICPLEEENFENNEPNINKESSPIKHDYIKSIDRSPYSSDRRRSPLNTDKSRSKSPVHNQEYKLSPYRSPRRSRSPVRKVRYSPGHYSRPLSPLNLNTEVLNAITMAPLSPRSAAFVLENRQILARRKMSPRRSSSRGSSCRSISPKRIKTSPRRRSRSPHPLSPRKRSISRSPKQKSISPRNQQRRAPNYKSNRLLPSSHITKRHSHSPLSKQSVHKRLGSRPTSRTTSPHADHDRRSDGKRRRTSRSFSLSLSPSPDRNYVKKPLNESTGYINSDVKRSREKTRRDSPQARPTTTEKPEDKSTDPVLEARKRKFQTSQIETNGIIKLKSNKISDMSDENETKEVSPKTETKIDSELDELNEELEDGVIDLNPSLDDLWSDEESNSENEGRFKSKPSSNRKKVTILPFTKLMNKPVPTKSQLPKDDTQNHRKSSRTRTYARRRSRSPLRSNTTKSDGKSLSRSQESISTHQKQPPVAKTEEIKKEGKVKVNADRDRAEHENKKIKSPTELEEQNTETVKVSKVTEVDKDVTRGVKLAKKQDVKSTKPCTDEKLERAADVINQNEDPSLNKSDDGDLRTELSRRRAERLFKAGSLAESLPTRLLKNALQDAVPKRLTTNKTSKGTGSSADRRVLVLKRLAASELDPAHKVSPHEGKLPIHMRLGLSSGTDLSLDEIVRPDRRPKRSRSGRRRKGAAVQV